MKWLLRIVTILLCMSAMAQTEEEVKSSVEYRLMVEQETALDFGTESIQKSEWTIDPEVSVKFGDRMKIFGQLRLYTEFADGLEPGRADFTSYSSASSPLHLGETGQLELRELYADIQIGKTYWRVGKQQVVWGETDGFKVLDRLNPMSFREFILDDFDDSRIPLWAVKGNLDLWGIKLTTYWSPDMTTHQLPTPKGAFYPIAGLESLPEGVEMEANEIEHPDRLFQDSDVGIQLAGRWKGWDLTFNYLYQYGKEPVMQTVLDETAGILSVTPVQKREHLIGGSFGNTWGLLGLRGELAYFPRKYVSTQNLEANGVESTIQAITGIAVDYFGISNGIMTLQWFGDLVMDQREWKLQRNQMMHTITIMHTQFLMNQQIEIEAFSGYRFVEKGLVFDLKTAYSLKDNFKIWVGGDLFISNNPGLISPFANRDRIMIGFEWGLQ